MEMRALPELPTPAWQSLLVRLGGSPLHLPEVHYGDYRPGTLRLLLFGAPGEECAAGPAFLISPGWRRLLGRRREVHLPTPPAGTGRGGRAREEIYATLLEYCRRQGFQRLRIGPSWGDCLEDLETLGGSITTRTREFVIDLWPENEALAAAMHKTHRKNIRRAQQRSLVVSGADGPAGLEALRGFQGLAAERAASRGAGFSVRDREYFHRVERYVYGPGHGEVLLAHAGDECVAALAYLHFGTRAITVRSGCNRKGYELYAMYCLHAELLGRARERGVRELNIGGVPAAATAADHPQHGLYEFKKGFGGREYLRTAAVVEFD